MKYTLFKYVNLESLLPILENATLRFNQIMELNDPFEGSFHPYLPIVDKTPSKTEMEQYQSKVLRILALLRNWRFTCFSDCNNNPLMWSHYAYSYRGACLCFEFNDPSELLDSIHTFRVAKVSYSNKICKINMLPADSFFSNETIMNIITTKDRIWSYENELRIITSNQQCEQNVPFNPNALKSITIGCRCFYDKRNFNTDLPPSIVHIYEKITMFNEKYKTKLKLNFAHVNEDEYKVDINTQIPEFEIRKIPILKLHEFDPPPRYIDCENIFSFTQDKGDSSHIKQMGIFKKNIESYMQAESDNITLDLSDVSINDEVKNKKEIDQLKKRAKKAFNEQDYTNGLQLYDSLTALCPDVYETWHNKGVILGELGRYDEAIKALDKAISISPEEPSNWYNKGVAYGATMNHTKALQCYEKALSLSKDDNVGTMYNKGTTLKELGRFDEALQVFDKAISLSPNDSKLWNNKIALLSGMGRFEEALKAFNDAEDCIKTHPGAWYNKAIVLKELELYEEANDALDKANTILPDDYLTWCLKANILSDLERFEEAGKALKKANSLLSQKPTTTKDPIEIDLPGGNGASRIP